MAQMTSGEAVFFVVLIGTTFTGLAIGWVRAEIDEWRARKRLRGCRGTAPTETPHTRL